MRLANILADFQLLDDWEDRYRYVIELGCIAPARATIPSFVPVPVLTAPGRFAVPSWSNDATRRWLDDASANAHNAG